MMHAPTPLAANLFSSPVRPLAHDAALHALLGDALARLAAVQQRCDLLEAQLQAGRQRESHHRHRAEHDDLTGIFNRAAFRDCVRQTLDAGDRVAVMMLDLDGFKAINDTLGHAAGDEVLRITAARLGHTVRGGDAVARLGGDEFACMVRNAGSTEQLAALAAKLAASVAAPMQVAGHPVRLTASLGLAISPSDGNSVDTLLASADAAMYRAKHLRQTRRATLGPAPASGAPLAQA